MWISLLPLLPLPDVLLPWQIRSAQVVTEVLVSETVIVGRVPDTFVNMGEWGFAPKN